MGTPWPDRSQEPVQQRRSESGSFLWLPLFCLSSCNRALPKKIIMKILYASTTPSGPWRNLHEESGEPNCEHIGRSGRRSVIVYRRFSTGRRMRCGEWDPTRLSQVISNLVGNAITYGDPKAPIRVLVLPAEEIGDDASNLIASLLTIGRVHSFYERNMSRRYARRFLLGVWFVFLAAFIASAILRPDLLGGGVHASISIPLYGAIAYLVLGSLRGFTFVPSTHLLLVAIPFFPPAQLFLLTLVGIAVSSTLPMETATNIDRWLWSQAHRPSRTSRYPESPLRTNGAQSESEPERIRNRCASRVIR
jgi:hypothetical protein